jgi:hypothetical protein
MDYFLILASVAYLFIFMFFDFCKWAALLSFTSGFFVRTQLQGIIISVSAVLIEGFLSVILDPLKLYPTQYLVFFIIGIVLCLLLVNLSMRIKRKVIFKSQVKA